MKPQPLRRWVAGVDGCRGGWVVVLIPLGREGVRGEPRVRLCPRFAQVLALPERPRPIVVDMPIGLLDAPRTGGRDCDRQARALLAARRSSVFSSPVRAALAARTYDEAQQLNGAGLSRQVYGILAKIREVDRCLHPRLQRRVIEGHPELAFLRLAGAPLREPKKTPAGRARRLRLLREIVDVDAAWVARNRAALGTGNAQPDDLVDACALALTARRVAQGKARRLPPGVPPRDHAGLRMEIWF
jgi:predicted RNase H-like nuclease